MCSPSCVMAQRSRKWWEAGVWAQSRPLYGMLDLFSLLSSPLSCFSPKVLQGRKRRGHPSKSTYLHICSDVGIFSRVLAGEPVVSQDSWKWTSGPGLWLWLSCLPLSAYLLQTKHYGFDSLIELFGQLKILSLVQTSKELTHVEPGVIYGYHLQYALKQYTVVLIRDYWDVTNFTTKILLHDQHTKICHLFKYLMH